MMMIDDLRKMVVGRCRQVRVRKDVFGGTASSTILFGFDLLFYRSKDSGCPPVNLWGDFSQSKLDNGYNHHIYWLFNSKEVAERIADILNDEIEDWCAAERKLNRIADEFDRGCRAVFPPRIGFLGGVRRWG